MCNCQTEGIAPDMLAYVTAEAARSFAHWQACAEILHPAQLATCVVRSQPWLVDPAALIAALQSRHTVTAAAPTA